MKTVQFPRSDKKDEENVKFLKQKKNVTELLIVVKINDSRKISNSEKYEPVFTFIGEKFVCYAYQLETTQLFNRF